MEKLERQLYPQCPVYQFAVDARQDKQIRVINGDRRRCINWITSMDVR